MSDANYKVLERELRKTHETVEDDDPTYQKIPDIHKEAIGLVVNEFTGLTNVYVEKEDPNGEGFLDCFKILTGRPAPKVITDDPRWIPLTLTEWIEKNVLEGNYERVRVILNNLSSINLKERYREIANKAYKSKSSKIVK